jgi:hypothetical protein
MLLIQALLMFEFPHSLNRNNSMEGNIRGLFIFVKTRKRKKTRNLINAHYLKQIRKISIDKKTNIASVRIIFYLSNNKIFSTITIKSEIKSENFVLILFISNNRKIQRLNIFDLLDIYNIQKN